MVMTVAKMVLWKVTCELDPIPITGSPISGYPGLGVEFGIDEGRLHSITHTFTHRARDSEATVLQESGRHLRFLFRLMEYKSGAKTIFLERKAQRLEPLNGPTAGTNDLNSSITIRRPINLPSDSKLRDLMGHPRLSTWLHLANLARDSAHDDQAVRNYYMIWEDMHGAQGKTLVPPHPAGELRFTRNFVSHGGELTHKKLLEYLETVFGRSVNRYEPDNPCHQQFVRGQRMKARNLIEHELDRWLRGNGHP